MGLIDFLKGIADPAENEDSDFFEGADVSFKPQPQNDEPQEKPSFIANFEKAFGDSGRAVDVKPQSAQEPESQPESASLFGSFGRKKAPRAPKASSGRQGFMNLGGKESSVMIFAPKTFEEAGEVVGYLMQNLTVILSLDSVPAETARRLLDFISGIVFALNGKVTPVSAKAFFITPQNVDILGAASDQPENSGAFF